MPKRAHNGRQLRSTALALLWALSLIGWQADAQPTVRVRAATRIDAEYSRTSEGVRLSGTVVDDLGRPLPSKDVELRLGAPGDRLTRQLQATTDTRGRFQFGLPLATGRYRAVFNFEGDDYHASSEQVQALDLERLAVSLRFVQPRERRMNLDRAEQEVVIQANSAGSGAGLAVTLRDELDRELGRGHTDNHGRLAVRVPGQRLGPPALGRLVAQSAADATRAAGRVEVSVVRYRPTALTLKVTLEAGNELLFEGSLAHSQGPLGRRAIGLFDGQRHLATVLTARDGGFRHRAPAPVLKQSAHTLRLLARFAPDAPWLEGSTSEVVELTLEPAPPPPLLWLLAPLLVALGVIVLVSRRRHPAAAEEAETAKELGAGIHAARGSRLGLAMLREVGGQVQDAETGAPLGHATVVLGGGHPDAMRVAVSHDGRFQIAGLAHGSLVLRIEAPGYAPLQGELAIPHRGEWSRMNVRLLSLRSAAYQAYQPAALHVLRTADGARRQTAREALAHARERELPTAKLGELTARVERAAYDRTPPTVLEVDAIANDTAGAIDEIRGAGSGPWPK